MKKAPVVPGKFGDSYRAVAISCLVGIAIIAVILFLSAIVISSVDFPQRGIDPLAIAAMVVGSLASGFLCGRLTKSGGILYGLLCGTIIFFVCLACELAFIGGELGVLAVYKFAICAISAMIGGILGVNKRRKPHKG